MKKYCGGLVCAGVWVAAVSGFAATRYVSPRSPFDGPGTEWYNACHKIQDAVNLTSSGDTVLVAYGVYDVGTTVTPWATLRNRVCITNNILLTSVNGPSETFIVGAKATGGGNGSNAVRCIYMSAGTVSGFSLTNGATLINTKLYATFDRSGGGFFGEHSTVLTNCILIANSAQHRGGGSHGGTLNNCMLTGNSAGYGGGGSSGGTLNNCTVTGNLCDLFGGGSYCGILNSCVLTYNDTAYYGGGSYNCTLNNCTLTDNIADYEGGSCHDTLNNCIVYYNTATAGEHYNNHGSCTFEYSCTTPYPAGAGNITNDPQFVYRAMTNLHLSIGSPCIDRGDNHDVMCNNDLDCLPRIRNGVVDMGAYEYQWPDSDGDYMPDRWEWLHCGSRTNLVSDADEDHDGHSNYQEYITGMNATNGNSCFKIKAFQRSTSPDGFIINWDSIAGRLYRVNRAANLMHKFQPLESDIQYPRSSYTDTVHQAEEIGLYRLDVQLE